MATLKSKTIKLVIEMEYYDEDEIHQQFLLAIMGILESIEKDRKPLTKDGDTNIRVRSSHYAT